MNASNSSITSLDELLDSLGFFPIDIYIYQLIIPAIGSIGFVLNFISLAIFFKKMFTAQTYDYFRIITISHLIQLLFAIPYGICFTPKYFPYMDSYSCAIVQSAYIPFTGFTTHFTDILGIAVLFERIKIFNSFVKKYFVFMPKKIILIIFAACLILNSVYALVYVPFCGGGFYFSDSNGTIKENSFWYVGVSSLADSSIGMIVLIVFYFIRDILTMFTTILLNIISLIEMRRYFKATRFLTIQTIQTVNSSSYAVATGQNENRKKTEKNAIKLVLVMCLISVVTRCVSIACDVYYLFSSNYIVTLLGAILDLVEVVGPALSFFIFYHFNRDFKRNILKLMSDFFRKLRKIYI